MSPRRIGVALVGSGLMGRAHASAYHIVRSHTGLDQVEPDLVVLADINEAVAQSAARRFGFANWTGDWTTVLEDRRVQAIDVVAPNHLHEQVAVAAAEAGRHVVCEKPLGRNADETRRMLAAVERAGVVHMVGFNYRQVPAVAEAAHIIRSGLIGVLRHCRMWYLQDFARDPNLPLSWKFKAQDAGSGALGGIGCHVIDAARFLVGEFSAVTACAPTWITQRPSTDRVDASFGEQPSTLDGDVDDSMQMVDVEDAAVFLAQLSDGVIGTFEISRIHSGHRNDFGFEVTGSTGSVAFSYERLNELHVYLDQKEPRLEGSTRVVTGPQHAHGKQLWPLAGLGNGFLDTVTLELSKFLQAILDDRLPSPDFFDGHQTQLVIDGVLQSARTNAWEQVPVAQSNEGVTT